MQYAHPNDIELAKWRIYFMVKEEAHDWRRKAFLAAPSSTNWLTDSEYARYQL